MPSINMILKRELTEEEEKQLVGYTLFFIDNNIRKELLYLEKALKNRAVRFLSGMQINKFQFDTILSLVQNSKDRLHQIFKLNKLENTAYPTYAFIYPRPEVEKKILKKVLKKIYDETLIKNYFEKVVLEILKDNELFVIEIEDKLF